MKHYKKFSLRPMMPQIVVLVGTFLCIYLAMRLFPHISLKFSNPEGIVGPLPAVKFNPATNLLRYLVFVGLPAVVYLVLHFTISKVIVVTANVRPFPTAPFGGEVIFRLAVVAILGWGLSQFFSFYSTNMPWGTLDFYHDGESLAPAMNYFLTGKLWAGSLLVHGAIHDPLTASWGWGLFGQKTIGAFFGFRHLLGSLIPLGLVFMILAFGIWARDRFGGWSAAGLISVLLLVYHFSDQWQYLDRRDFPVLVGIALILLGLTLKKSFLWMLVGILSPFAFFYSIDRGGYYLLILLSVLAAPLLLNQVQPTFVRNRFFACIIGMLLGWGAIWAIYGTEEISAFSATTIYWVRWKDYMDSYVYPFPALGNFRHSVPLILVMVNLLMFAAMLPRYRRMQELQIGTVHLVMAIAGFVYFRSALGRSDEGHLRYVSTFIFLGSGFLFWGGLEFLPQMFRKVSNSVLVLPLLWISASSLYAEAGRVSAVPGALRYFSELVKLSDETFLGVQQKEWIATLKSHFRDERCLFSFSNDNAVYFLLRKQSCTRFIAAATGSTKTAQKQMISELEGAKPSLLIYSSPTGTQSVDGIQNSERLPIVNDYILRHYRPAFDEAGWKLFRRVEST